MRFPNQIMVVLFWSKHAASFVLSQSNRVGREDRAHAESTFIYLISVRRIFLALDMGYSTHSRVTEQEVDIPQIILELGV